MTIQRRLGRIFRPDGRALIVALDHALIDGPRPGLERPGEIIAQLVAGGADVILTSYGVARRFARELASVGLILRADGGATSPGIGESGSGALFLGIEQALRVGADALAISAPPGSAQVETTLQMLAQTVAAAHVWGMPVMAEMLPGGFDSPSEERTLEALARSAWVGAELGADFVKVTYAASIERVTSACYVPVVVLGGARPGDQDGMLAEIRAAVDAGAAGVAVGRSIFQARDPAAMTAAIAAIVHAKATAKPTIVLPDDEVDRTRSKPSGSPRLVGLP